MTDVNERAVIGGNNPPPFEESREEIEGLYLEAKNWADGEEISNQEHADAVAKLIDLLRKARARADERRKEEARPFDEGKAEVQARYNPLISEKGGKVALALDACKKALAPYLNRQAEAQRLAEEKARQEAWEAQQEAIAAMQAAKGSDLDAREQAEALVQQAKEAEQAAKSAEKVKAQAKGGERAVSLRTRYEADVTSPVEFARYAWEHYRDEMGAFLQNLAEKKVANGARSLPGVTIKEVKSVQ